MITITDPNLPRGFVYAESEPELIHTTQVLTNDGVNHIVADGKRCGSCWHKSVYFECGTMHDPAAINYQSCHLFNKRLDNAERPLRCDECFEAEKMFEQYQKVVE